MTDETRGLTFEAEAYAPENTGGRVVWWMLVGLAFLLVAGYLAAALYAGTRLPEGTRVQGVPVGGLEPADAEQKLRVALRPRIDAPVAFVLAGRTLEAPADELGLSVDWVRTVGQAGGGRTRWAPDQLWDFYGGARRYDAVVRLDRARFDEALERLTEGVYRAPREGSVTFGRTGFTTVLPIEGTTIDHDEAADALQTGWLDGRRVSLPLSPEIPDVDDADLNAALETFAQPATSAPVTLRLDGSSVTLPPRSYLPLLAMQPADGRLRPQVDADRLAALVTARLDAAGVDRGPVDATVRLVGGRPEIVAGEPGFEIVPARLAETFLDAVAATKPRRRTVVVPVRSVPPEVTRRDIVALGIREPIGVSTIGYAAAAFRTTNTARAAAALDGTLVRPGQTLSLASVLGSTAGYASGPLAEDGATGAGPGAGLSRVASALHAAAWAAGLRIEQQTPMPWFFAGYPPGFATSYRDGVDLVVRNDSRFGVLVEVALRPSTAREAGSLTVRLWSTRRFDVTVSGTPPADRTRPPTSYDASRRCVPQTGQPGFSTTVTRVLRRGGAVVRQESSEVTYAPLPNVVCVGE